MLRGATRRRWIHAEEMTDELLKLYPRWTHLLLGEMSARDAELEILDPDDSRYPSYLDWWRPTIQDPETDDSA